MAQKPEKMAQNQVCRAGFAADTEKGLQNLIQPFDLDDVSESRRHVFRKQAGAGYQGISETGAGRAGLPRRFPWSYGVDAVGPGREGSTGQGHGAIWV